MEVKSIYYCDDISNYNLNKGTLLGNHKRGVLSFQKETVFSYRCTLCNPTEKFTEHIILIHPKDCSQSSPFLYNSVSR